MSQSAFWKPKFLQSAFAQVVASAALFTGHMDQATWQAVTVLIVGMFSTASVVENKIVPPAAGKQ